MDGYNTTDSGVATKLVLMPCTIKQAKEFISDNHRHHPFAQGGLFAVRVCVHSKTVGVALVGRPVARALDDGITCEIVRVATDTTDNACSILYGACRRAAKALGYRRIITYTLEHESGASLHASGFERTAVTKGRSWSAPSRPRDDKHPLDDKVRWEVFFGV